MSTGLSGRCYNCDEWSTPIVNLTSAITLIESNRSNTAEVDASIGLNDKSRLLSDAIYIINQIDMAFNEAESLLTQNFTRLKENERTDMVKLFLPHYLHSDSKKFIEVSARQGTGIDELIAAIARRVVPTAPAVDEALPFLPAHVAALTAAAAALAGNDSAGASAALACFKRR